LIIKKNDGIKRNIYILKNISETAVMHSQRSSSRLPLYLGHKPVVDVARPVVDVVRPVVDVVRPVVDVVRPVVDVARPVVDVARPVVDVDVAELKKQFAKLTDDVAKLKYAERQWHNCNKEDNPKYKSKLCINMTHAELIPVRKDKLPTERGNRGRGNRGRGNRGRGNRGR